MDCAHVSSTKHELRISYDELGFIIHINIALLEIPSVLNNHFLISAHDKIARMRDIREETIFFWFLYGTILFWFLYGRNRKPIKEITSHTYED